MMSRAIGYYNEQEATTERLYSVLREIKRRLEKGAVLGKAGRQPNDGKEHILMRTFLPEHGVSTKWSAFACNFDYKKPISPQRVAVERHRWMMDEEIRWALRHPQAAAVRVGAEEPTVKEPEPKAEPRPREEREERREIVAVVPDIRLHDWHFTSGMKGVALTWALRDGSAFVTTHALAPQVYTTEAATQPDGKGYVRRVRVSGSFEQGKLTKGAMRRLVREARDQIRDTFPALALETEKESNIRFQYLMR